MQWETNLNNNFSGARLDSPAFLIRHQDWLKSNSISELFAACRIETDVHGISLESAAPTFDVPDVLIHCTTARAAKVWSFEHWKQVINTCTKKSISVGLVGSPSKTQRKRTTL